MFEQILRVVLALLAVGAFTWYSSEISMRYSSRFSFARVALSFGSMFISMAILAYIVAPERDTYIHAGMEIALVTGAVSMAMGVISMPIGKLLQRRDTH